jgi:hypothetical protein
MRKTEMEEDLDQSTVTKSNNKHVCHMSIKKRKSGISCGV